MSRYKLGTMRCEAARAFGPVLFAEGDRVRVYEGEGRSEDAVYVAPLISAGEWPRAGTELLVERSDVAIDGETPKREPTETERKLLRALEWALPYAEQGHEAAHPGETYVRDGYVAASVKAAREALEAARKELEL